MTTMFLDYLNALPVPAQYALGVAIGTVLCLAWCRWAR